MSNAPPRILLVALATLLLAGVGYAAGAQLLLPGDVHLQGQIEKADADFVHVRLGDAVYELERRGLSGEGLPEADGRAGLIEALLPHLDSEDPRVREAARAALVRLAPGAQALLRAAHDRATGTRARAALEEILGPHASSSADASR